MKDLRGEEVRVGDCVWSRIHKYCWRSGSIIEIEEMEEEGYGWCRIQLDQPLRDGRQHTSSYSNQILKIVEGVKISLPGIGKREPKFASLLKESLASIVDKEAAKALLFDIAQQVQKGYQLHPKERILVEVLTHCVADPSATGDR